MKPILPLLMLMLFSQNLMAQGCRQISAGLKSSGLSHPFTQFTKSFIRCPQPGVGPQMSLNGKSQKPHQWHHEFRLAGFNHRVMQNGIPLSAGMRHRCGHPGRVILQAALGGGCLGAFPGRGRLKPGTVKKDTRAGKSIPIADMGIGYSPNIRGKRSPEVGVSYRRLLRTPFVRTYLPLLPYNSLMVTVGISVKGRRN